MNAYEAPKVVLHQPVVFETNGGNYGPNPGGGGGGGGGGGFNLGEFLQWLLSLLKKHRHH